MAGLSSPYCLSNYFDLSLSASEAALREAIRDATYDLNALHPQFPLHAVYVCISDTAPAVISEARGWVRVARACAAEGLRFWLPLSRVGWEGGSIPPHALAAVLADEGGQELLGLFMHEPSIPLAKHFPDQVFWFDFTQFRIPANPCSVDTAGLDQWDAAELSFRPEHGAFIEPLPAPVVNPVQPLVYWREALSRWAGPHLRLLAEANGKGRDVALCLSCVNWVTTNKWYLCGFAGLKQAMGLHESGVPLQVIVEINNQEHSIGYAEARGVGRARGTSWGTMVGGVRWKYWNAYLEQTGRPFAADYVRYGQHAGVPGWLIFVPLVAAWQGGATAFDYEIPPVQVRRNADVRQALRSFYEFLAAAATPVRPDIRLALLKGDAWFAWDVPGYGNGMEQELNVSQRYYAGLNSGSPRWTPTPLTGVFYPRAVAHREWYDAVLSGNPYGDFDLLPPDAPLDGYDTVVLVEWNRLTDEQHARLRAFAANGGTLWLTAGQCFEAADGAIDWRNPAQESFYRAGDLTDLCGTRLLGGADTVAKTSLRSPSGLLAALDGEPGTDSHLYLAEVTTGEVVLATDEGRPICVRQTHGDGAAYLFLGPSYRATVGSAAEALYHCLARDNRRRLRYRVSNTTEEEAKDLLVTRDRDRLRVVLTNYWIRHDMHPVVTLPDAPGAGEYVETWAIHDAQGCVAQVEVPSRGFELFRPSTVLPTRTTACVTYEPRHADGFHIVYRHPPTCLARQEVELSFGPLQVTVSWPETGRVELAGLQLQHCPGLWDTEAAIRTGDDERVHRLLLESGPDGDIVLPAGVLAQFRGGEVLRLTGRRPECES